MNIRNAIPDDAEAIRKLLLQLDYPVNRKELKKRLEAGYLEKGHEVLVYEAAQEVIGFISVYFVRSLAVDDGLAVISYLSVDENHLGKGIGKALEQAAEKLAWERQCDRMQVHCRIEREKAHGFYKSRGYREYPVFYSKRLIYAE